MSDGGESMNTTRKRVMVEGDMNDESFFIEEIIEESEDETDEDEQDNGKLEDIEV